jgi:hypothetical protein
MIFPYAAINNFTNRISHNDTIFYSRNSISVHSSFNVRPNSAIPTPHNQLDGSAAGVVENTDEALAI